MSVRISHRTNNYSPIRCELQTDNVWLWTEKGGVQTGDYGLQVIECRRQRIGQGMPGLMRLALCVTVMMCMVGSMAAQSHSSQRLPVDMTAAIVAKYSHKMDSLTQRYRTWHIANNKELSDPYYHLLFNGSSLFSMPYHRLLGKRELNTEEWSASLISNHVKGNAFSLSPSTIVPKSESLSGRQNLLLERLCTELTLSYGTSPELVRRSAETEAASPKSKAEYPKEVTHVTQKDVAPKDFNVHIPVFVGDDEEASRLVVVRPNFWNFKSDLALQFMQTYVSENWYKGGESNFSLLGNITLEANYNNKQKVSFDNKLEMKLGFQESRSDKYHRYKSNADLLRLTNKLGYRAASHWYYTTMLQSWTQFYPSYKSNDEKIYSSFMSPFETLLSFGMDYKLKHTKFNMNLTLSPLAANLKYVKRDELTTSFGIDEGKHFLLKFGSNITGTFNWEISKNITWGSRLYFFSDYKTIQAEWENTINMKVNRYFSTRIFVYPRFDNAVEIKDGESYFQLNEYLSIGLNYTF